MSLSEHKNTAIGTGLGVVITAVIGWLIATSDAGMDAAEKARIQSVVDERLLTDNGVTYAQELRTLNTNVVILQTSMDHLAGAIDDLAESQQP